MEKKEFYFLIFVLGIILFISCSNNSGEVNAKIETEQKTEDRDTLKTEVEESINSDSVTKVDNSKNLEEKSTNTTVRKDVFEIYKNGVRQKIVIAWNPNPDQASEDWVWFVNDIDRYFKTTHPVENLLYFSSPPKGISGKDMESLSKELGFDEAHQGYYLISEKGEKGFIPHDLVSEVISKIYSFFEMGEPDVNDDM
jgi:hypothetical protein